MAYEFLYALDSPNPTTISTMSMYLLLASMGVGIVMRYSTTAIVMGIMLFAVLVRGCLLFANDSGLETAHVVLNFFGRIIPAMCTAVFCFTGSYTNDWISRRNFVRGKKIRLETSRLEKHKRLVAKLLALMLPPVDMRFSTIVDDIEQSYCLFLDVINNHNSLRNMDIQHRVRFINYTFKRIDEFLGKWPGVEKIKTISTTVLLLIPVLGNVDEAARKVTNFSITIKEFLCSKTASIDQARSNECDDGLINMDRASPNGQAPEAKQDHQPTFSLGVSYGSVVAGRLEFAGTVLKKSGIVGKQKFCYDVYGDTVNTASRMQKLGIHDVICTKEAYLTFGAVVNVKGKGELEVYGLIPPHAGNLDSVSMQHGGDDSHELDAEQSIFQLLAENPYLSGGNTESIPSSLSANLRLTEQVSTPEPQVQTSLHQTSTVQFTGTSRFFLPAGSAFMLPDPNMQQIGINVSVRGGPIQSSYVALPPTTIDQVDFSTVENVGELINNVRSQFHDTFLESFFVECSIVETARRCYIHSVFSSLFTVTLVGLTILFEYRAAGERFSDNKAVVILLPVSTFVEVIFLFVMADVYGSSFHSLELDKCRRWLLWTFFVKSINMVVVVVAICVCSTYGMEPGASTALILYLIVYTHFMEPLAISFPYHVAIIVMTASVPLAFIGCLGRLHIPDIFDIGSSAVLSAMATYSHRRTMREDFLRGRIFLKNEQETKKEMIIAASLLKAILPPRIIRNWLSGQKNLSNIVEQFK
ncbi:hypothetical protein HDU96_001832, partial [Phlyctochytrium bullatum]